MTEIMKYENTEHNLWKRVLTAKLVADEKCRTLPSPMGTPLAVYTNWECKQASEKAVEMMSQYQEMVVRQLYNEKK